jgi:hypothetical protein
MLQLLAQTSSGLYDTSYSTSTTNTGSILGALGVFLIPALILLVITIIGMWKVFVKAGKPGWASIVPIYNLYVALQIAGLPWWWLLVFFFGGLVPLVGPLVSIGASIYLGMKIGEKFGKSQVWGAVLCGFLAIGYIILGFGSAQYQAGTPVAAPAAPTGTTPPTA